LLWSFVKKCQNDRKRGVEMWTNLWISVDHWTDNIWAGSERTISAPLKPESTYPATVRVFPLKEAMEPN
jgi:hypothetical protein